MSSIPELILHDATSNEEFELYFKELESCLSKSETIRERLLRLIEVTKVNNVVEDGDFLKFVPLVYGEFKVIALFAAENNYLLGFLTQAVLDDDGSRLRRCYIILENISSNKGTIGKLKNCVTEKYDSDDINFVKTGLGVAYTSLEKRADLKRIQIRLGRQALIEAIKFLSTDDQDFIQSNLGTMAKHCIVIIQMFCESFRLRMLAEYRLTRFEDGFIPPEFIVIQEHGWSIASKSLQSQHVENQYNLHVADVREDALSDFDLHQMYDLLLPFDAKKGAPPTDFDKVLTTKYLHAWFKDYVKSRLVNFESTDQVTAVILMFREYVVLQFNHLPLSNVRVDVVETLPSHSLAKVEHQPLQDNIPGRTFVTFQRVDDVPVTTISSNLRMKDVIGNTNNLSLLDVLELSCKDFFESRGLDKFYVLRDMLLSDGVNHCIHLNHPTLYTGKKLHEAITAFEGLFDMQLGEDQVNPDVKIQPRVKGTKPLEERPIREKKPSKKRQGERPNKNRKLIHGIYMNKYEVFVTVLFAMRAGQVQYPEVKIVCQGEICRAAIVEIFKDWQQENCDCITDERPAQYSNLPDIE